MLPDNSRISHPTQNQNSKIRYLYKLASQIKLNANPSNLPKLQFQKHNQERQAQKKIQGNPAVPMQGLQKVLLPAKSEQ
jgi:hypothetical protein